MWVHLCIFSTSVSLANNLTSLLCCLLLGKWRVENKFHVKGLLKLLKQGRFWQWMGETVLNSTLSDVADFMGTVHVRWWQRNWRGLRAAQAGGFHTDMMWQQGEKLVWTSWQGRFYADMVLLMNGETSLGCLIRVDLMRTVLPRNLRY